MKLNVGRLLSRVFEYRINKSVIFFISQIMDRHVAQLHVATVTTWKHLQMSLSDIFVYFFQER